MPTEDTPSPLTKAERRDDAVSDVLTFGEAMALFMAQTTGGLATVEHFQKAAAGAELNVAIGLSRLGLRVDYVSAIGRDSFGAYLRETLLHEGIDTRFLREDPSRSTGLMLKTRTDDGSDPQIEYHRRGSAASAMSPSDITWAAFPSRHLHLTGIALALSPQTRELSLMLVQQARAAGASISFDPNLRPQLWKSTTEMVKTINQVASLCDVVLPGIEEARLLTGQNSLEAMAEFYLQSGARQVAIKLGGSGAYCKEDDGSSAGTTVAPFPVKVVDTVGAGDGFAVGVISGLLEKLPLQEAAMRGNFIASKVIQFHGDSTGLPNRAALLSLA